MVLQPGYPSLLNPKATPKTPNPITLNHPENFRRVTKATILVKKKEGLSDEEFVKHYCDVHAQMARSVLERHGCEGYSITYHLQRDRNILQDMLHGKAPLLPYDAICTFIFPSYKHFAMFMYDPESKALTGDHENFMVEEEMKMMVGDEYVVFGDMG